MAASFLLLTLSSYLLCVIMVHAYVKRSDECKDIFIDTTIVGLEGIEGNDGFYEAMAGDEKVQGTNDSSIVSKLSMVERGYFADPYIKYFVEKPARRSPLINRCYYARAAAVSYCMEKFLADYPSEKQIISLGAGFDTSYFRLKSKCLTYNLKYIELDFPAVLQRKIALAKKAGLLEGVESPILDKVNKSGKVIHRSEDYICIGYDLRYVGKELSSLLSSVGISFDTPTLFLSEVVLAYLSSKKSTAVLQWASQTFSNAVVAIFEQVTPRDSFGTVMCKHFKHIGSPLRTIMDYSSISSHIDRHKLLGLSTCHASSLDRFFYECIDLAERKRIENLEIFDEFEAWHLACQHYFILCSTNSKDARTKKFCESLFPRSSRKAPLVPSTIRLNVARAEHLGQPVGVIRRFGHCTCVIQDVKRNDLAYSEHAVIFGGFGTPVDTSGGTMHRRLNDDFAVVNLASDETSICLPADKDSVLKLPQFPMFSSMVCSHLPDSISLVFFGGRSSPTKSTNQVAIVTLDCQPKSSEWTYKVKHVDSSNTECPSPRWRHTATALKSPNESCMIIFGGRNEDDLFNDCWNFDITERLWSFVTLDGDIISPRHSHSMCLGSNCPNSLILSGGLNSEQLSCSDLFEIKFQNDQCTQGHVRRLKTDENLSPRYSHTSHVVDDLLLLVGGVTFKTNSEYGDAGLNDTLDIVNLLTGAWLRTIELADDNMNPIMLHNHSSVLLRHRNTVNESATDYSKDNADYKLVVFGGGDNCFSFGTWLNYTPLSLYLNSSHFSK